jgi:rhodanese-related sulfurtransferase
MELRVKVLDFKTSILRLSQAIRQGVFLVCLGALLAAGFNGIRPGGLPWIGQWSPSSVTASYLQDLQGISLAEAWSLFLDARDPVSFGEGHITGAMNCPPGETETSLEEVLTLARSGLEVIAYCDGVGCSLSPELARTLQRFGVPSVKILEDGWSRWLEAGYPIGEGG